MLNKFSVIRKFFFGLPFSEANFKTRGFQKGEDAQNRLELVAKVVVSGYNSAIENGLSDELLVCNRMVEPELKGFFNEGIGMGLYTLDLFSFKKERFWNFIKGAGRNHEYMSYIGAGIACGVFKRHTFDRFLDKASPTSGLLLFNGLGFYYAYFKPKKGIEKCYIPKEIVQDTFFVECYDNGIGRALWFYHGANEDRIAKTIATFPKERQAAIWSGVGLAATYAGGVSAHKIRRLKLVSGTHYLSLAEGAILASHTRDVAKNPHKQGSTELILTGKSALECNRYALAADKRLAGRRMIEGTHSFKVFLAELKNWVKDNHKATVQNGTYAGNVDW